MACVSCATMNTWVKVQKEVFCAYGTIFLHSFLHNFCFYLIHNYTQGNLMISESNMNKSNELLANFDNMISKWDLYGVINYEDDQGFDVEVKVTNLDWAIKLNMKKSKMVDDEKAEKEVLMHVLSDGEKAYLSDDESMLLSDDQVKDLLSKFEERISEFDKTMQAKKDGSESKAGTGFSDAMDF